jgi:hypothetical protein
LHCRGRVRVQRFLERVHDYGRDPKMEMEMEAGGWNVEDGGRQSIARRVRR